MFDLEFQPDFAPMLQKFQFGSGKKITLKGRKIGQALQSARRLAGVDIDLLEKYSKTLKPFDA